MSVLRLQRGMNFLKQKTVPKNPDFLTRNQSNNVFSLFFKCIKMLIKERVNYIADKEHCFSPLNPHLFDVFRLQKSQTKLAPCIGRVLRLLTLLPSLICLRGGGSARTEGDCNSFSSNLFILPSLLSYRLLFLSFLHLSPRLLA